MYKGREGRTPKSRHILNAKALTLCQTTGAGMSMCMFWVNKNVQDMYMEFKFSSHIYPPTCFYINGEMGLCYIYIVLILTQSFSFFLSFSSDGVLPHFLPSTSKTRMTAGAGFRHVSSMLLHAGSHIQWGQTVENGVIFLLRSGKILRTISCTSLFLTDYSW